MMRWRRRPMGKGGRPTDFLAGTGVTGLLVLFLVGCGGQEAPGERVLRQVEPGTLKGEVYRALGPGPVDSLRYQGRSEYGYPVIRFLVEGEMAEVVWIPQEGYAPGDSIHWEDATPVLFRNFSLLGWGWGGVEPLAEEMGMVFQGMSSWIPPASHEPPDPDDAEGERTAGGS